MNFQQTARKKKQRFNIHLVAKDNKNNKKLNMIKTDK